CFDTRDCSAMYRPYRSGPAPMPSPENRLVIGCRRLGLLLALLCLNAIVPAGAQSPNPPGREPIAPIVGPPAQDARRVGLGERLFRDQRLSGNNTRSCASCHDVQTNGASAATRDLALDGQPLAFNTLTVFNASLSFRLNWEGKFRSLEELTERIIRNPLLM